MNNAMRVAAAGATLALAGMSLAACSGPSNGGGSGGGGGGAGGTGPITYVQGKDTSGVVNILAATWNKAHPKEKVTIKQQTDQADQQFQDLTQHFQQKLNDYDVVSVDVVWTAEFAAKQYLQPLTGQYKLDTSALLPSVVKTGAYNGVQYAAPSSTDSQLLYYRKDLLGSKPVPKTLEELFSTCGIAKKAGIGCYAGQYAKYEGLTVNFNEAITSAGGTVVDDKGKPTLNTPEAAKGLQLIVDNFRNGNIPKAAVTYQEQQGLNAFETGKLMYLTNWPYMVADIANNAQAKDIRSKYAIAGYPGKSAVGGHNLAISAFSDHKATALKFIKFMESAETQKVLIDKASLAPIRSDSYTDTALTKKYPYLTTLKASLDNASARPISPYYQGVTGAIQNNVFQALQSASTGGSPDVKKVLDSTAQAITAASAG
jgi:multiple sugar transport system substrate-binding protein